MNRRAAAKSFAVDAEDAAAQGRSIQAHIAAPSCSSYITGGILPIIGGYSGG